MPNYIPYLLIILVCFSMFLWLIARTRSYQTVILYLTYVGMVYIFEYFVLVILDAYAYIPHFIANPYLDNMLGAFVSNFVIVPVLASLIAVLQLHVGWIIAISLLLCGIEWLFLQLGIYQLHWWKISYTFPGLLFFFWLTRLWYRKVMDGNRIYQYITFLMFTFTVVDSAVFLLLLSGIRQFQPGVYENMYRDDVFFSALYAFIKMLVLANSIYWSAKLRFAFIAIGAILVGQFSLIQAGILKLYVPYGTFLLIYLFACTLIICLLRYTRRFFRS
ncbi:hypothetical protein [Brevibacillus migulae]|uniref:hypothetical protein n=1 Tax=Brevibacillus migulae TaxID=1644114 RepID=UPI00106EFF29|nr:hypothetical protein [Brevibacillus migulae]